MKKTALALFQLGITALLLWWVFRDEGKRHALNDAVHQANWWWLAAGIAAYGLFEILAGIRWQILLRVQGVHLSWWRLYGLLMVGLFFSLFIPGGTGGDRRVKLDLSHRPRLSPCHTGTCRLCAGPQRPRQR